MEASKSFMGVARELCFAHLKINVSQRFHTRHKSMWIMFSICVYIFVHFILVCDIMWMKFLYETVATHGHSTSKSNDYASLFLCVEEKSVSGT
jgi:hypothetical protein